MRWSCWNRSGRNGREVLIEAQQQAEEAVISEGDENSAK